jgi:hypothetical protein
MKSKLFLAAATMVALLSAFIAFNQINSASQASGHEDNKFRQFEAVPLEDAIGPQSFAFDPRTWQRPLYRRIRRPDHQVAAKPTALCYYMSSRIII